MKKGKKLLVTASLVSTAMTLGGCRFLPWVNENADVYGPPPDEYVTMKPVLEAEEEDGTDITPIPEDVTFSPEENLAQCMYGPPVDRENILKKEEE